MAIKNYTTDVPVNKTISEIHLMLADHGAKRILFDYGADSRVTAISFVIDTPAGEQGVRLPSNAERVREVLRQQRNNPKCRNRSQINDSQEQAERVAWRIVKDWLAAQLAILETEMVTVQQVFLPYFLDRQGRTLYEVYSAGALMLEGDI
jgi:hypothetical protein